MNILFSTIPKLSTIFSGGRMVHQVRLLFQMYWFVVSRKFGIVRGDFALLIHNAGKNNIFYIQQPMDLRALAEVFVDKEYDWEPETNFAPKVIVDLGAHIGDTALYYHLKYPEAVIIAVEASPSTFVRLEKNVQDIENIIPVFAAIGPVDGEVSFNLSESSLGSSVLNRPGVESSVVVPQISLVTLLKNNGIKNVNLIKFDIEGGEFDLFKNIAPATYADAYRGELHFDLVNESKEDFLSTFSLFETKLEPMQKEGRYLFSAIINLHGN